MELLNKSKKEETIKHEVKVLTIKKYINSKKEFTGEEDNLSIEKESLDMEGLKNLVSNIALFNKQEEERLLQEGFNQNYIFMKKLIK